jgi:DNA replication protein DnaC
MDGLIKMFTERPEEPSEKAITLYSAHYAKMFYTIGYQHDGIKHFDRILDFMARYHLATGLKLHSAEAEALWESELKDKTFPMPNGLMLRGSPGTGKTFAARIIAERFSLPLWDTYSIGLEYLKKDGDDWLEKFVYGNTRTAIVIDDIGAEGALKKYGNESPMGMIFTMRAKYWEKYGTPTIYTTNFTTPQQIADFYGNDTRLLDRLTAYQVGVEFTGASKRK